MKDNTWTSGQILLAYVLIVIMMIGLANFWFELYKVFIRKETLDYSRLSTSLYAYFPALSAGAAYKIFILDTPRYIRFKSFVLVAILVIIYIMGYFIIAQDSATFSLLLAVIGTIIAIIIWYIANAGNEEFKKRDDIMGGNANSELAGNDGEEFKL